MKRYFFSLNMTYLECQALYFGTPSQVVITADSGERIQLPVSNLRPFVQSHGIKGRFCLDVDANNKITSILQIA